jgi:putative holliday junction resolvase
MALPKHQGPIAGIDLGKARVGVALSDELGMLAHPKITLDGRNRRALLTELRELAEAEGVTHFVVGWPLGMRGEPGIVADRAARFAQQLADATGREVELLDERLTTVQATRELRGTGADRRKTQRQVDGVAAALILQVWLDRHAAPKATKGGSE